MKNRKAFKTIWLMILCVATAHCSGHGTTSVGNSTITVGKLTSSFTSTVTIPLAAFGTSDADVATTTLTVYKNAIALSGDFDLASHYDATTQVVNLTLTGLSNGDLLTFLFTRGDGTTTSTSARVSATVDMTSSAAIASTDLLADANVLIHVIDASNYEVSFARSIFSDDLATDAAVGIVEQNEDGSALNEIIANIASHYNATTGYVVVPVTQDVSAVHGLNLISPDVVASASAIAFSPDIGGDLSLWNTLYTRGFVGTGTNNSTATYAITEASRTVSSGCLEGLSNLLNLPTTMMLEQTAGQFVFVDGGYNRTEGVYHDASGIVNSDDSFTILEASAIGNTWMDLTRLDGFVTESAISATYVYYHTESSFTCRIDIGFVGTAE